MIYSRDWILYAGAVPEPAAPVPLQPWVQELASAPRVTIGELEDGAHVPEAVPAGWQCAVLPEYILAHTLVAAVSTPSEQHAMLFLTKSSAEFHCQERPPAQGLLGWFHIRLAEPVTDKRSLVANIRHAVALLHSRGVVNGSSHQPRSDA